MINTSEFGGSGCALDFKGLVLDGISGRKLFNTAYRMPEFCFWLCGAQIVAIFQQYMGARVYPEWRGIRT